MTVVTVGTALPIPAERACQLAQKPALLAHVLWPWVTVTPGMPLPDVIAEGDEISIQIRFLGLLPGWTHTLRIEHLAPREIVSCEHGGPVTAWNHRLTFEPMSSTSCRYTDTVEVRAGLATPLVALFARLIYRYRQARWRALARILE
jgi:ligand-binding SRPBCC domain-containing protein